MLQHEQARMESRQVTPSGELFVRNIGGIDQADVQFTSGVTVLSGRNATNRTSLLQSIMAALGSDNVSMKASADEARVELTLGDETYTREFERRGETVVSQGDPYLEDTRAADLFAFLLESNEARRAVVTESDLRDVLMRPVDTDEIHAEIDRLVEERRGISNELDELEELKRRLPSLEEQRQTLREDIEETEAELREVEAEIEARDEDIPDDDENEELEAALEQLRTKRTELEDTRYELETERSSLDSLREERRSVEQEREDLETVDSDDLADLAERIDTLRSRKQRLESELNDIQSVIRFNEEMLEGGAEELMESTATGDVTAALVSGEQITCWTCGSDVERDQIDSTIDRLRDVSQETVSEISDIDDELTDLQTRRDERESQKRRNTRLSRRLEELTEEIAATEARIDTLTERREQLQAEIADIETTVESLEQDEHEELLELHSTANQLGYDLGSLENELERVEDNITTIENRLDEEAQLEQRREELSEEITELRTQIERIERQTVEEFNEHMETVLDLLEYENIARIWLERKEETVREGRQTVSRGVFELHIVRRTESGATYKDSIHNLSQSEREVTGLLFALAGYLAHEVYESLPVILLDSLEAIDADRIARLVEYFEEFCDFLVVALLPEDAEALSTDYHRITEI